MLTTALLGCGLMADPLRPRIDPVGITERARAAYGLEGRLALPHTAHWPIFPFETDDLQVRPLRDPVLPEPPRRGEAGDECGTCRTDDDRDVWNDERWRVSMPDEPQALPGATLHSRDHLDFGDLSDEQAAEMGVLLIWIQRALAAIEGVGRVHVYKWGDGGAHLHIFVVARPVGMIQLKGMFLTTWLYALPPLDPDLWTAIRAHLRTSLDASRQVALER